MSSIAWLRRYDGYTFAPRLRAFKTGCADGYVHDTVARFDNFRAHTLRD
jgi:hypothetical protein